jgi:hypothetical protein
MNRFKLTAPIISLLILSACGGTGSGDSKSAADTNNSPDALAQSVHDAQGIYSGHFNRALPVMEMALLDDGTYWIEYSGLDQDIGIIQGHAQVSNGDLLSGDAVDLDFMPKDRRVTPKVSLATISGKAYVKKSMDSTIRYADASVVELKTGFFGQNTGYGAWYDKSPDLGHWVGNYSKGELYLGAQKDTSARVSITSDGSLFINAASNCKASGKLVPRAHGNVFDMVIYPDNQCDLANEAISGIAFAESDREDSLWLVGLNADRTNGMRLRLVK